MTELTPNILFANDAISNLAGNISNTATSVSLTAGSGVLFPAVTTASGQIYIASFNDAATGLLTEIVHCTNVSTDTMTIVRAQEGTTALAWLAGDFFANRITAGTNASFLQIPPDAVNQRIARYQLAVARGSVQGFTTYHNVTNHVLLSIGPSIVPSGLPVSSVTAYGWMELTFSGSGPWSYSLGISVDGGSLVSNVSGTTNVPTIDTFYNIALGLAAGSHTIQLVASLDANTTTSNFMLETLGFE